MDRSVSGHPLQFGERERNHAVFGTPSSGDVELLGSTLLGIDPATVEALDRLARERWDGDLDGFGLAAARWQRPPDHDRFVMAYRSGGEEGSPAVDLVIDVETGTVTESPTSAVTRSRG